MTSDSIISVRNVTKKFRIHTGRNRTLKEKLIYAGRSHIREFVAVDDVSIDVPKGATVGLLGANGSGKSTLLKLISKILYPDHGVITVEGRVSSLLELGAGFHPDFSGRENIFMNGAILGLSRKEVKKRLDEIVEFSELGDFIHEPVRNYSSGMYMRLAFSVAVAVDPDVLLIDEILAVGDAAFQAKCMSRIKQLQRQGKTIVMVTHDSSAIERFCDHAVWMNKGKINVQGDPVSCIQSYIQDVFQNPGTAKLRKIAENPRKTQEEKFNLNDKDLTSYHYGNGEVSITHVQVSSLGGNNLVNCGDPIEIRVKYTSNKTIEDVVFGVGIFAENAVRTYGTNTLIDRVGKIIVTPDGGEFRFVVDELLLLPGTYLIDVAVHSVNGEPYHYWRSAAEVRVVSDINDVGVVRLRHRWKVNRVRS